MHKIKLVLLSYLVLNQTAFASQIYRFVPPNDQGGYSGVITEFGDSYRFLTYDSWVILGDDAAIKVWAVDDKGQRIKGMTVNAQATGGTSENLPDKSQLDDDRLAGSSDQIAEQEAAIEKDAVQDAAAGNDPIEMQIPEEELMKWKQLAAYRGHLGYGLEALSADGGISEYSGSSNILQYGLTLETLKDLPRDFRVSASYLGHLSTYKTEEDVDNRIIDEIEEDIRVDRFSFSVEKGIGDLVGLSNQSDLSLGLALRLTSSPVFRDIGDGSGTGFIKTDRFRTLGLVLDFRSQAFGELYRVRSNAHFGILDDDIDVSLFDLEAVYIGSINSSWKWELGIRNESNKMKVDFTCPANKVCDKESTSVRTELGLFLGIASYISVPDFEG